MAVLASITALLGLIFLIATVAGMFAPALFKDKKTGEIPKRSHILVGGICASLITFAITGAVAPAKENAPAEVVAVSAETNAQEVVKSTAATEDQPAEPVSEKPSLGLSVDAFSQRFNAHMAKLERPYRLKPKVANNIFSVTLNDHLAVSGGVSEKTGELNSLMIIGGGDGTPQSGMDTMMIVASAYAAVLGMDDLKSTGPEVLAVIKAQQENTKDGAKRVLNDVKLYFSQNELMGNFFAIEPASL